jgi:hypothetical protein
MVKYIENIGLICDFMGGALSHDELHSQTSIQFNDYIYGRHHVSNCRLRSAYTVV